MPTPWRTLPITMMRCKRCNNVAEKEEDTATKRVWKCPHCNATLTIIKGKNGWKRGRWV